MALKPVFVDTIDKKLVEPKNGDSITNSDRYKVHIKEAYESNADTNVFTDNEKDKLTGIESGATADQTDSEIKIALENNPDTNTLTDAEKSALSDVGAATDLASNANKLANQKQVKDITDALDASIQAGTLGFETKALMDADTTQTTGTVAQVMNDATASNNGYYRWDGALWIKRDDLYSTTFDPDDTTNAIVSGAVYDFYNAEITKNNLPYNVISWNNFVYNSNGVSSFNSGTFTFDDVNDKIVVDCNGVFSEGVQIGIDLTENVEYKLTVNLNVPVGGTVNIYNVWSNLVAQITTSGSHDIYLKGGGGSAFGNKIVLSCDSPSPAVFDILEYYILTENEISHISPKIDVDDINTKIGLNNEYIWRKQSLQGLSSFNGATIAYDKTNRRIETTVDSSARGLYLSENALNSGDKYLIGLNVDKNTTSGLQFRHSWSNGLVTLVDGWNWIEFTFTNSASFENKPVLSALDAGTFYLTDLFVYKLSEAPITTRAALDSTNIEVENIKNFIPTKEQDNNFTVNTSGISSFNGGSFVLDGVNDRLEVTAASGASGVYIKSTTNIVGNSYVVEIDVTEGTAGQLKLYSAWNRKVTDLVEGRNIVGFIYDGNDGFNQLPIIIGEQAGNFYINSILVYSYDKNNPFAGKNFFNQYFRYYSDKIEIGKGAKVDGTNGTSIGLNTYALGTGAVVIGDSARSNNERGVAIGWQTKTDANNAMGAQPNSGEATAVGEKAVSWGWRATAIGAKAHAGGQSSTAIGTGAFASRSHSVAVGRGSLSLEGGAGGWGDDTEHYFGSRMGHRFPTPPGGISVGGEADPSLIQVTLHGQDAKDWRPRNWNNTDTYEDGEFVVYSGDLYIAKTDVLANVQPDSDATKWGLIVSSYSDANRQSEYNVAGGDLAVASGRGTGSAIGGKLRIKTAPVSGTAGQNEKNPLVDAAYFDSENSVDTRFVLLDVTTGTYKRVTFGAADSGGLGKKVLVVDN